MQRAAHGLPERLIDELMLLELGFARKLRGNNDGRKMVIVAGKVRDLDLRIGDASLDEAFDLACCYWHCAVHTCLPWRLRVRARHKLRQPILVAPRQLANQYGGRAAQGQRIPAGLTDDFAGDARGFGLDADRVRLASRRREKIAGLILAEKK